MIILEVLRVIIVLLFVASLVGIGIKRLNMPYTVGLVLVGLLAGLSQSLYTEEISLFRSEIIPEVILGLLVPPLVYEAAFHIQWPELRRELPLILTFAIPGVVLTTVMVAGVIVFGSELAFPVALVLGSLLAATDPVAVTALFRALGAPKRLALLVEGESLFNDGTAVVVFSLMLAFAVSGEFNIATALVEFLWVSLGGIVVGVAVGLLITQIISRVDDHLIEITLTLVAAYGSYLLAEEFHFAGVLAVVAAGLMSGNVGPGGMSEETVEKLLDFWEFLAYSANSFIFLLIGLIIELDLVIENLWLILLSIVAILLARAVVIYGFSYFSTGVSPAYKHVLYWGGLRGAISLALVLSISEGVLGEDVRFLEAMAYGVVLFTLLVKGVTMEALLTRLGLIGRETAVEH